MTSPYLALWHRALEADIGVGVKTDDRRWLQNVLYEARKEANDPRLEGLVVMIPPDTTEVWICHKTAEL